MTTRVFALVLLLAGVSLSAAPPQAPEADRAGSIGGIAISSRGGNPLRGVTVSLTGATTVTAVSDGDGRWAFGRVPPGRYVIEAVRQDFLPMAYGQKAPGRPGTPFEIAPGQHLDLRLELTRGSVITGTAIDDLGDPLVRARVRLLRFITNQNGVRRLRVQREAVTDDRGVYRFAQVEPGTYWVSAVPGPTASLARLPLSLLDAFVDQAQLRPDGSQVDEIVEGLQVIRRDVQTADALLFSPTYHPSSPLAKQAAPVEADGLAEISGIDIRVLPTRLSTIRGVVTGRPTASTPVQVLLHNTDPAEEPTSTTMMANADGSFELDRIAPGQYIVYAQTLPSADERNVMFDGPPVLGVRLASFARLHGRTAVAVEGPDAPPIAIALMPGRSISGRVVLDFARRPAPGRGNGTTISIVPAPQPAGLPAFNTSPQAQVDADGHFMLPGIRPGRYFLRASGPGVVTSVELNGLDTLDFPLEVTTDADIAGVVITLTDRVTEISGSVVDASGGAAYDATVLAIATDSRYWFPGSRRVATTRPGPGGHYALVGLPPGDYRLVAIADYDPATQFDGAFLQRVSAGGINISVTAGGRQSQNLRVRP